MKINFDTVYISTGKVDAETGLAELKKAIDNVIADKVKTLSNLNITDIKILAQEKDTYSANCDFVYGYEEIRAIVILYTG